MAESRARAISTSSTSKLRPQIRPPSNMASRNPLTPLQSLILRRWRPQWVCSNCQHRQGRAFAAATRLPAENAKPYYVTTPIFYPSAAAHTGHAYSMVLADVLKRWQVLQGNRAILATGVDEHGMKIQRAAVKAGIEPKELCDKNAQIFKDLAEKLDLSNDVFVRTTDERHREAVEYACQMLQDKGYIYESKHEGWYSVSDETFYPEGQVHSVVDPPTGRKMMASIETGSEVEWTSERNYHFRLSEFRDRLLKFYEENPSFIVPNTRMQEVVNQVTQNLEDLSISRPYERLTWGIQVPNDPSQTIYVWLDALLNYASAAGYPFLSPGLESTGGWPADVHVIGKDIVRFHCIYWPAFLMALDLPLPKQVLTHAHWTLGRHKMAKSTGNVVNPFWAMERFGTDTMRWYLAQEGGIQNDSAYDNSFIIEKYKKGLSGGLGNLVTRVLRGKRWNVQQAVRYYAQNGPSLNDDPTAPREFDEPARELFEKLKALPADADAHMRDLYPNKAIMTIMQAVYDTNAYLQQAAPWYLAPRENDRRPADLAKQAQLNAIIFVCAEAIRVTGILLQPVMPTKAKQILDMLGVDEDRRSWEWCVVSKDATYGVPMVDLGRGQNKVLFPRLSSEE